jgi:hypothetical protein
MLGEFFVASDLEIDDGLAETGPHGRFPAVEANGLSHVPIARLGELLGAGSYDDLLQEIEARPSASGEAVLFRIGRSIRDAIAVVDGRADAASAWAATDELRLSGWSSEPAEELLGRLAELSQAARGVEKDLWYWWSL